MISFFDLDIEHIDNFPDIQTAINPIKHIIHTEYDDFTNTAHIKIYSNNDIEPIFNKKVLSDCIKINNISIATYHFRSEITMITEFLNDNEKTEQFIGYNINKFDIDYLKKRASNLSIKTDIIDSWITTDLLSRVQELKEESNAINSFVRKYFEIDMNILVDKAYYLFCSLCTIKVWQYFNTQQKIKENDTIHGYHLYKIEKGILGQFSKIKEEFLEAEDAIKQNNSVMALVELSDLLGAIEAYAKTFNMSLNDLLTMKDATKRAFETGRRK